MQFTTYFLLLTSTFTSSLPLSIRDASTVVGDITSITSSVTSLDDDVKGFDGSITSAIGLISGVGSLKSSITDGTSDITSSSAFDDADSASIITALQTLVPEVTTTLTDLNVKASVVASAGFTSIVLSNIKELHSDADAFFTALGGKIGSSDAATVTSLQATTDDAFNTAESNYAG